MKWNVKKLFILLLLQFSLLYCQETSSIQSNLTSIEDFAINIENNSLQQKKQIENLQIDLEESQRLLEESKKQQMQTLQMQEELLKQLKSCEAKSKNWKTVAGVSISLSIISIGTLIMVLNN